MRRIALIALVLAPISWLYHAVNEAREAARRAQCVGHLSYLSMALRIYHDQHGSFPPAVTYGPDGRPWHSWRAFLIPYFDVSGNRTYTFDEPWDGPRNRQLRDVMPHVLACPSQQDPHQPNAHTDYVAVVGPGTCFPPDGVVRLDDIADGPAQTIMLVEVADSEIPWLAPIDLDASTFVEQAAENRSTLHPLGQNVFGRNVLDASGRVRYLRVPVAPAMLRALTTISGGEPPIRDWLPD
jgi:hypothetical protein